LPQRTSSVPEPLGCACTVPSNEGTTFESDSADQRIATTTSSASRAAGATSIGMGHESRLALSARTWRRRVPPGPTPSAMTPLPAHSMAATASNREVDWRTIRMAIVVSIGFIVGLVTTRPVGPYGMIPDGDRHIPKGPASSDGASPDGGGMVNACHGVRGPRPVSSVYQFLEVAALAVTRQPLADEVDEVLLPPALQGIEALLDAVPDAMVVVGEKGRILRANRHAVGLFGYELDELVGAAVELLVPLASRGVHPGHRRDYERTPTPRPMRSGAARHKDGTEFPVDISLAVVPGTGGRFVCATIRDVRDRRRIEAELAYQSLHDSLTGLPNRVLLVDRAQQAAARCWRDGSTLAVLFVGLDRFKILNDSHGHAAGDAVLVAAAGRLAAAIRPSDTVARFAGDEFAVVCDVAHPTEATAVASRIATAFDAPFITEEGEVFLTASIGIATGTTAPENLIRDANTAMVRAKEAGRDRTEFFDLEMRAGAAQRLEIHTALHHAGNRDELCLLYQPIVDASTGDLRGAEALLRWNHPDRGRLGPAEFVALAEETGLIVSIGAWAIREALGQWARWHAERPNSQLVVNVNLSATQIRQPNLVDVIIGALEESGAPPEALCLELTESVLMADLSGPRRSLTALRDLGIRLAIDDFGTGYSSLTYLKRLPVNVVKISQDFVAGLGVAAYDSAIVAAVIDLAHTLDLTVVAEGVETPAQHSLLRSLGCDLLQGHLFGSARPASDLP